MKKTNKALSLLLSSVLAASMLSACGMPSAAPAGSAPASSAPAGSAPAESSSTGTAQEVVLRVVDWSDSSLKRREEFNKKFEEQNPGVKIEYTMLTIDQFKNTIITMIKSGEGPDLFPIPTGMTLSTALQEEWYQSMSPYLTPEFIATIEDFAFQEGITTQGGEIYTLPENTPIPNTLFYYNQDVLDKAGVTALPKSYDEFVEVCKQISQAGKGQYYGLIEGGKQLNRVDALLRATTYMSGGKIGETTAKALTVNGEAPLNSPELQAAVGLLDRLAKEGGLHPDTVNLSAPEAREMFAQGQAAFLCQGMWCIPPWSQNYPDLNYGVMAPPSMDGTVKGGVHIPDLAPWMGIYKQSKQPELAAKYMMALFSEEYGYQSGCVSDGNYISIVKGINDKYIVNDVMKQYYQICQEVGKNTPVAATRDPKVYDFYAAVKDVSPTLGAIGQGVMANSISNYKAELDKLTAATTTEWKRAAESVGLDFGVFEFANWDVAKSYTTEDYAALK